MERDGIDNGKKRRRRTLPVYWAIPILLLVPVGGWLVLSACLTSSDFGVRSWGVLMVGRLRIATLAPRLVPSLKSPEHFDFDLSVWALGRIGDPRYIPPLIDALEVGGSAETEEVAEALIAIDSPRALAPLTAVATDSGKSLTARRYARYAITRITRAPDLQDFVRSPGPIRNEDYPFDAKYTETQQQEIFRKWWAKNKDRYPAK